MALGLSDPTSVISSLSRIFSRCFATFLGPFQVKQLPQLSELLSPGDCLICLQGQDTWTELVTENFSVVKSRTGSREDVRVYRLLSGEDTAIVEERDCADPSSDI